MEEHQATRYGGQRAQDTSRVRGPLSTTRSAERPMSRLTFFPYLEVLPSPAGRGLALFKKKWVKLRFCQPIKTLLKIWEIYEILQMFESWEI